MRQLLDNFPLARTAEVEQLRPIFATLFQDSIFDIDGDRNSVASYINYCPLHYTGLLYGNFGTAIRASFGEMRFFVQGTTVRGTGEQQTNGKTTSANVGGILFPHANLGLHFGAGFEYLALNIEADALTRKLGAIIGASPQRPIEFEVDPEFNHPAALMLRRLVASLARRLSANRQMSGVALIEMEQVLMACFLIGNPNNYSHLLNGRFRTAAPRQVKRAEEYIEASWDQPLTVEALSALTSTSARSLFLTFKHHRGYSPMAFLRQVRLRRAWLLLNGDPSASVTDVAYACGFGNLGHFAKYFRTKYGEAPSAVLSRTRIRRKSQG